MRSKAAALLIVVALTALGAGAMVLIGNPAARIADDSERERERTASALAAVLEGWLASLRSSCEQKASSLAPWTGSPQNLATASPRLDRMVDQTVQRLYIVDRRSRVVAADRASAALVDLTRGGDWVDGARSGAPTLSGVETDTLIESDGVAAAAGLSPTPGEWTLICWSVIGPIAGVNQAAPATGSLLGTLDRIVSTGGDVSTAVVARAASGAVEVTPMVGQRTVQPAGADLIPPARSSRRVASMSYEGEGGVPMRASAATACCGWSVIVYGSEESLVADASQILLFTRLIIAGLVACAIAIVVLAVRRIAEVRRQTDEAKRAFLAIAGHELRTPLTVIRGFSQTLTVRWDRVGDDRKLDILRTIARHARSLEHLVERLLLGAQLEAGVFTEPSIEDADLGPLVEQVAAHHRELTHLHEIEVKCAVPVTAKVDPKLFGQVLTHLLENAVKYSPSGGLVTISLHRDGRRSVVVVEDEGVGLPADIQGIFSKFVQGEAVDTRTHDEGGVGIGLFIVKTHLDRMGGSIKAERRPQGGARFVVSVPR